MRISCIAAALLLAGTAFGQHSMLPDPKLTPGATNPSVTQANIHQTICVANWTKTIRPPVTFTNRLKAEQMAALKLTGKPSAYEEDHLISLEVGGNPTEPGNLWPEPWPEARLKDQVEDELHRAVCAGTITLADAQHILATDWVSEYTKHFGHPPVPKK